MPTVELGQLKKVDIRKAFPKEAQNFTPWLAKEENLSLLGEELGLNLEAVEQEKRVGKYRLDLLCRNSNTKEQIVIENQFSETDHWHLGQLLTYAAGLSASTVIWIAETLSDEHKAVLDWLNSNTPPRIAFFGVEIELWQIDESRFAPKFNVCCQPNNWSALVQEAATSASADTELKQVQYEFWTAFRKYMEEKQSSVKCQKPAPKNWMYHPIGKVGFVLLSVVSSGRGTASGFGGPGLVVGLEIDGHKRFQAIEAVKDRIENELGEHLAWHSTAEKRTCSVYVRKEADFKNESEWPAQRTWLKETLEKFQKVFVPIIMKLDHSQFRD